jgi:hypothetical protein
MALSGKTQALIASYVFGILFTSASAGVVLYVKGHGLAIFRDGLRLSLVIFLLASALWAQIDFLATLIEPSARQTCQVALVFTALFDQLSRVAIEQFLLWAVTRESRTLWRYMVPQVAVFVRLVLGLVYVGETKVQFNPTCVALSGIVPVSIATIAMDAVILAALAVLALSGKVIKTTVDSQDRIRAILITIASLAIWMGVKLSSLNADGVASLLTFFTV